MDDGFTLTQWREFASDFAVVDRSRWEVKAASKTGGTSFVEHQFKLRKRASEKFSDPDRWLWTKKLLEQSSDEWAAKLVAAAYPASVHIVDFCCGAGSDSAALSCQCEVTAIDSSPIASLLASVNLGRRSCNAKVVTKEAELSDITPDLWVHIDPDRREGGKRTTDTNYFSPGREFLVGLIQQSAGGSIKVAPATKLDDFLKSCDLETANWLRSKIGIQFISRAGSVRQQRWWWNVSRFPPGLISVSTLGKDNLWSEWRSHVSLYESTLNYTIESDARNSECFEGYLGDADVGLRAARLQLEYAEKIGARLVGNKNGYFWIDGTSPPTLNPWVDWFLIREVHSFDRKRLKKRFKELGIGVLEIKTRNVDIDIDRLRKDLALEGELEMTLMITKIGERVFAFLTERVFSAMDSR